MTLLIICQMYNFLVKLMDSSKTKGYCVFFYKFVKRKDLTKVRYYMYYNTWMIYTYRCYNYCTLQYKILYYLFTNAQVDMFFP